MRLVIILLCFLLGLEACTIQKKQSGSQDKFNPFFVYNFGGLENYSPERQINMLQKMGYEGVSVIMASAEKVKELNAFLAVVDKYPSFRIY